MKATLNQIKTDESVWPKWAEFYDQDIEAFYRRGYGRVELLEVTGEWVKSRCNESDLIGMIPRPTKAFVPEVGKWYEVKNTKVKCFYIGVESTGFYALEFENGNIERYASLNLQEIKSEREKLVDLISLNINKGIGAQGIAEAVLSQYKLEEKDGGK